MKPIIVVLTILFIGAPIFGSNLRAYAYSVNVTSSVYAASASSSKSFNWENLINSFSTQIQNFLGGLKTDDGNVVNLPSFSTVPSTVVPPYISTAAQNGFQQFDAWLYHITGFHIAVIFTAVFQALIWIFGLVQSGLNWLVTQTHLG